MACLSVVILAVFLTLTLAPSTQAETIAFSFDGQLNLCAGENDTNCAAQSAQGTDGFKFRPSADIRITDLGYFDHNEDGIELVHPVGIFDFDTQDELVRADVDATSFLDGRFRYSPVAPLTLTAGRSYVVAGFHPGSETQDFAANTPANLMTGAEIELQEYFFAVSGDLEFPTQTFEPFRFFGPNFRYVLDVDTSPIDFNGDDQLNCDDVDALVTAVASNAADPQFDLNNDFQLDRFDVESWLTRAGLANNGVAYELGDANLDGTVDDGDLDVWALHRFGAGAWCAGDFTADGLVDGSDFNVWNQSAASAASNSVPEPGAQLLLLLAVIPLGGWYRGSSRHRYIRGIRPQVMARRR